MLRWLLLPACLLGVALAYTQELQVDYAIGDNTVTMDVRVDAENDYIYYHVPEEEAFEEMEMIEDYYSGYAAVKVSAHDACYIEPLRTTLKDRVEMLENNPSQNITESVNTTSIPLSDDDESDLSQLLLDLCDGYPMYEVIYDVSSRDDSLNDESSNSDEEIFTQKSKRDDSSEESDESSNDDGSSDESSSSNDNRSASDESAASDDSSASDESSASDDSSASDEDSDEMYTRSPGRRQVSVTFKRCVVFVFFAKCFVTTLTVPTGASVSYLWLFG